MAKIKGFVLIKLLLQEKKRVYIHNGKRQLFSKLFSFRKSIPPTVWAERKLFNFVHQQNIYIFRQVTAQSEMDQGTLWIIIEREREREREREKERERAIYDDSEWLKALNHCHKETHFRYVKVPGPAFGFY